ncbi:MAG: DUF3300 domain-containing protein, partial [Burkholderiales bacterium]|nr:DUF3300 domain-containing protein [Burkholderiales bacterium]
MKTRFFLSQYISTGCRSMLLIAAAGLLSIASPALAQGGAYSEEASTPISQEALDNLLAPIALYPDVLLAQVLMAATYPWEVIEAAEWQAENDDLEGEELQDELEYFDWDPSVKSLLTVPSVLQYMSESSQWMQDLGRAVVEDQPRVMAAVQMLRQKAYAAGTLKSNERQVVQVNRGTTRKIEYITIAPPATQVVYVPVYDTRVVYGNWWWPSRPVYWGPPAGVVFTSGYYWGPRRYSSVALWGSFNWGGGLITVNAPVYRNYYRHAPPRVGPNYGWHRPPPPRGYYNRPPPPRPYAGRSSSRPSYGSPRDSRSPGRDRPRSDYSGRDRPRGGASGDARQAGARQTGSQRAGSERASGTDRSRGGASGDARQAGARQTGAQQLRTETPSGADRSRGGASGDARQMGGRTARTEAPSGASGQRGSASGDARQTGGRAARTEAPSGASGQRGSASGDARQTGGRAARTEAPSGASGQRGSASGDARQTGGRAARTEA